MLKKLKISHFIYRYGAQQCVWCCFWKCCVTNQKSILLNPCVHDTSKNYLFCKACSWHHNCWSSADRSSTEKLMNSQPWTAAILLNQRTEDVVWGWFGWASCTVLENEADNDQPIFAFLCNATNCSHGKRYWMQKRMPNVCSRGQIVFKVKYTGNESADLSCGTR